MLAYLANRPVPGHRQSSPNTLLLVISVHVALLAVVMSAKMDLPGRTHREPPIKVDFPIDPSPLPTPIDQPQTSTHPAFTNPTRNVPPAPVNNPPADTGPIAVDPGPIVGGGTAVLPAIPKQIPTPIHHDARLLTPASELKPPYPASKLLTEEEAVLTLRLTIDASGRVVAVDPVGRADRIFLEAARSYAIAHWRYQPATDDGRAVASSLTVTLRFELDG
jgi:protein TonB